MDSNNHRKNLILDGGNFVIFYSPTVVNLINYYSKRKVLVKGNAVQTPYCHDAILVSINEPVCFIDGYKQTHFNHC